MAGTLKLAFFLPNTFTALNMACGFSSILFSFEGKFYNACLALILGAIFDSVDGRLARFTGTQSAFGEQFDSLSDLICFGAAPAFLVYNCFFLESGKLGLVVSFCYLLCGALRLARFNSNIDKVSSDFFQGLPIPGAALALSGYVLFFLKVDLFKGLTYPVAIYVLFYSILMISNIRFSSFKSSPWIKEHKKTVLLIIFLLLALVFVFEHYVLFVIMTIYVPISLVYFFVNKGEFKDVFIWKS
ncbi:CDP-diacylglycerol--serine O-phosphatidyltransferase [Bacteriovoracales bacterium]|nr:CDP-diacylglycerol--serine O-phosphatidyltransferase [Bacteriovoracales bacterium]